MSSSRPTYTVRRDRWAEGLGVEELSLFASELSDRELIALQEPYRSEALSEIRCVLQHGERGLEVVADPALDAGEVASAGLEAA
jgi:hypothetical protein